MQAFDNQEYPLEALVDEIVEKRDLTRNPLFDVLFTLQNNENETFQIDDWSTEQKEASFTNAKFDLSMTVYDNNGYKIALEYAQELFEQDTIERMLTHFMELLSNIADEPTAKISEIEMVTQMKETSYLMTLIIRRYHLIIHKHLLSALKIKLRRHQIKLQFHMKVKA